MFKLLKHTPINTKTIETDKFAEALPVTMKAQYVCPALEFAL